MENVAGNNKLHVTTSYRYDGAHLYFNTISGHNYVLSYEVSAGSTPNMGIYAQIYQRVPTNAGLPGKWVSYGFNSAQFTAVGTTYDLKIMKASNDGTFEDFYIDNVVIEDLNGSNANYITNYAPDIISSTDYYAFGSIMPGRNFTSSSYRYGFNGKEKDPEGLGGSGATYDYGFRIYNPNLCRFLSVDPLTKQFPFWTPYQFAGNNSISGIDLDGLEYLDYREARVKMIAGEMHINLENFNSTTRNAWIARDNATGGTSGNIGYSTKVGSISYADNLQQPSDAVDLDTDYDPGTNPNQYSESNKIQYGAPNKKDGTPDMRFKGNKLNRSEGGATATPSGRYNAMSKGLSASAALLNVGMWVLDQVQTFDRLEDQIKVDEHTSILVKQVAQDLKVAISKGMIPKEYLNTKDIGNIANVVLSGTNPSKNNELYTIGMEIVKKISKNYRPSTTITTGDNGSDVAPSDNTSVNKTIVIPKEQ